MRLQNCGSIERKSRKMKKNKAPFNLFFDKFRHAVTENVRIHTNVKLNRTKNGENVHIAPPVGGAR